MREQLIQYVNLLFAGAPNSEEIKQEILQNTLDRYDDLVSQGKSPEAAYRLAISGIGDINEILGNRAQSHNSPQPQTAKEAVQDDAEDIRNRKLRAVAIAMYILCAIPLFILSDMGTGWENLGLSLTLVIVAFATYLMLITKKKESENSERQQPQLTPQQELKKSIGNLIWAIGLSVYLVLSFATGAWYITWLLFPIMACVKGIVNAVIDLKEANKNEN